MSISDTLGKEANHKTGGTSPTAERDEIDDLRELATKTNIEDPNERAIIDEILSDKPRPLSIMAETLGIQLSLARELRNSAANKIRYRAKGIGEPYLQNPVLMTILSVKVGLHPTVPKVLVPFRPVMPPPPLVTAPKAEKHPAYAESSPTHTHTTQATTPAAFVPPPATPVVKKQAASTRQEAKQPLPPEKPVPRIKKVNSGSHGYAAKDMGVGAQLCRDWILSEKKPLIIYNEQMRMVGLLAPVWLAKAPLQNNAEAVLGITPIHALTNFLDDAEARRNSQAITVFNLRNTPVIAFIPSGANAANVLKTAAEIPEEVANWEDVRGWANKKPSTPPPAPEKKHGPINRVNEFMVEQDGQFFTIAILVGENSNALMEWMNANQKPVHVDKDGQPHGVLVPRSIALKMLDKDRSLRNKNHPITEHFAYDIETDPQTVYLLSHFTIPQIGYVRGELEGRAIKMTMDAITATSAPAVEGKKDSPDPMSHLIREENGQFFIESLSAEENTNALIEWMADNKKPITVKIKGQRQGALFPMEIAHKLLNDDVNIDNGDYAIEYYFGSMKTGNQVMPPNAMHLLSRLGDNKMAYAKGALADRMMAIAGVAAAPFAAQPPAIPAAERILDFISKENDRFFATPTGANQNSSPLIQWILENDKPVAIRAEGTKELGIVIPLRIADQLRKEDPAIHVQNFRSSSYFANFRHMAGSLGLKDMHTISHYGQSRTAFVQGDLARRAMEIADFSEPNPVINPPAPDAEALKKAEWNTEGFLRAEGGNYFAHLGYANLKNRFIREWINAHDVPVTLVDGQHNKHGVLLSMRMVDQILEKNNNLRRLTHRANRFFIDFANRGELLNSGDIHIVGKAKGLQMAYVKGELAEKILAAVPTLARA